MAIDKIGEAPVEPKPEPVAKPASQTAAEKAAAEAADKAGAEALKQAREDKKAADEAAEAKKDTAIAEAERVEAAEKKAAADALAAQENAEKNLKSGGNLAPAGESSEAAVQKLLAERQTAELNHDATAAASVTRQLAALGYK